MYKFFYNLPDNVKIRSLSESSEDDEKCHSTRKISLDIPLRIPTRKRILSASRVVGLAGGGVRGRSKSKRCHSTLELFSFDACSFHGMPSQSLQESTTCQIPLSQYAG